jgi:hypothetical protein
VLEAVRKLAENDMTMTAGSLRRSWQITPAVRQSPLNELTPRERDVVREMAMGRKQRSQRVHRHHPRHPRGAHQRGIRGIVTRELRLS